MRLALDMFDLSGPAIPFAILLAIAVIAVFLGAVFRQRRNPIEKPPTSDLQGPDP